MNHDADSTNADRGFPCVVASLKRLAMRYHVPASECGDCAQEALLAWQRAHPDWVLDDPTTRKWLSAVVINRARLFHRQRRCRAVDDLDSLPSHDHSSETVQEAVLASRHKGPLLTVRDRLSELGDLNRKIVIGRAVHDRTYAQIAEGFGLTPEAVRRRYNRSIRKIRNKCNKAILRDDNNGEEEDRAPVDF